jgi:hypothetical protein
MMRRAGCGVAVAVVAIEADTAAVLSKAATP